MSFEKNKLCYICGEKCTEAGIFSHKRLCLKKWQEEHERVLQGQLNPSFSVTSIFPSIQSRNQIERHRAIYESAKIEVLSCRQCVPCVACKAESLGKRDTIIIRPPQLKATPNDYIQRKKSIDLSDSKEELEKSTNKICYICGQEYSVETIELHELVCLEDWKYENNKLPTERRRPMPQKPDFSSMSFPDFSFIKIKAKTESIRIFLQQNNLATVKTPRANSARIRKDLKEVAWEVQKAILIPCQKCGRKILPDRFVSHLMSCMETKKRKPATTDCVERPVVQQAVLCYVCGRKWGKNSIENHEKKCLERWKIQHIGKPLPVKKDLEIEYEAPILTEEVKAAWRLLTQPVECNNCGHTFRPDSFVVHEKNCFHFEKNKVHRLKMNDPLIKEETYCSKSLPSPNDSLTSGSSSSKALNNSFNEKENEDPVYDQIETEPEEQKDRWYCPNCVDDRVTICASANLYKNIYNLY